MTSIVTARQEPIREILKRGDQEIGMLSVSLMNILDAIAEMYTSADYSRYSPEDRKIVFSEMSRFVIDRFPMLGLLEIRDAFSLAASGKINADLRAWHGKFTIAMLGGVLGPYKAYSKRVLFEYDKGCELILGETDEKQLQKKNEKAKQEVISAYLKLKETYQEDLEIDESKIFVHWGRILVEAGYIDFTADQKKEIYSEAKALVKEDATKAFAASTRPHERRELRSLIEVIDSNTGDFTDFKNKADAKYAILIVKKSIINQR